MRAIDKETARKKIDYMNRYFFDFDEVPDRCGLTVSSADKACVEALLTMPAYVVEKLEREGGKSTMVCTVRGNENNVLFKIVMSMHVEDGSGTIINPPLHVVEVE